MKDRVFAEAHVDIPVLDLREDSVSGLARRKVAYDEDVTGPDWDRMIILVHGYRSSKASAQKSYAKIVANIRKRTPSLEGELAGLYWPGDWHFKNPAAYSDRLATAEALGKPVAKFIMEIRRIKPRCRVVLVGHSLGCRLILEALRELHIDPENRGHKPVSLVFLMGAAVPSGYMEDNRHLREGLSKTGRVVVLFSTYDDVLSRWYRLGQLAERDRAGNDSDAIGLRGAPMSGVWHASWEMTSFKHDHYWGRETTVRGLAHELGVYYRDGPPSRPAAGARSLANGKPLEARIGPERADDRGS